MVASAQLGPVVENPTLGPAAGIQTHEPVNLLYCNTLPTEQQRILLNARPQVQYL